MPDRGGWSLRHYIALFVAVLFAVAAVAGLAVRTAAEQDAREAAEADASFAARVAATQINGDLLLLEETTAKLAANPQVAVILAAPVGPCSLTFGAGPFSTGHLDIVSPDGSVKCSSQPTSKGAVYGSAGWLPRGLREPIMVAPFLDPVTGLVSAVIAAPVDRGAGTVVAIVALG